MRRSCITIERQYGSGGREVGRILSHKLGIPFYDGELLLLAAERFGLNPGVLKEKDEKRSRSLLHDIAVFAGSIQDYRQMFEPYQQFEAVSGTIRRSRHIHRKVCGHCLKRCVRLPEHFHLCILHGGTDTADPPYGPCPLKEHRSPYPAQRPAEKRIL